MVESFNIFQPAIRINYATIKNPLGVDQDFAIVWTYSLDNERLTRAPKQINVNKIPLIVFQLVDAGYTASLDTGISIAVEGAKSILLVSPEWLKYNKQRFDPDGTGYKNWLEREHKLD